MNDKNFLQNNVMYTETIEDKMISIGISSKKSSLLDKNSEKITIQQNLFNKIFEYLIPILDESFNKRLLSRYRLLLSLLKHLSSTNYLDIDSGYKKLITEKLLNFIMTLKSFTQTGSNYIKNSLLIIGNLMIDVDEVCKIIYNFKEISL